MNHDDPNKNPQVYVTYMVLHESGFHFYRDTLRDAEDIAIDIGISEGKFKIIKLTGEG